MKTVPVVSVIVPVYNAEKYLEKCLESICTQSYADLQVILINDGSTDRTVELCQKYAGKDDRITLLSQENQGVSKARNVGLSLVKGKYLLFVDADDELLPNALLYLVEKMEQTKADLILFGWKEKNIKNHRERYVMSGNTGNIEVSQAIKSILSDNESCGGGYPWNKFWRTDSIRENGKLVPFHEEIFAYEDKLWNIQNLMKIKKIYIDSYVWYQYNLRTDSLSHQISDQVYKNGTKAYYYMMKEIADYDKKLYIYACEEYFSRLVTTIFALYRSDNRELLTWMLERFQYHQGEIYYSKRFDLRLKLKAVFIDIYNKVIRKRYKNIEIKKKKDAGGTRQRKEAEFMRKMKIGYLLQNYPEQRCIIDKINTGQFTYSFQRRKYSKYTLFMMICEKLHLYHSKYAWAIYNPILNTDADFIHSFNTVCDINKPWCASFETILPRTDFLLEKEGKDSPFLCKERWSKKAFELMKKSNCRAILPISEYAKKLEICLIENADIENKDILIHKIQVLHPPQKLYMNEKEVEEKFSKLPKVTELLFVGRAFFRKGGKHILEVLELLQEVYDFHLTIVSCMEAEDYITNTTLEEANYTKCRLKKLHWITYYEQLSNQDVMELCKKSHIGLLPTLSDTYGYSVLEMQSCGCPVVTTNVNALPEINDDTTGWICNLPKDSYGTVLYHTKKQIKETDKILKEELMRNFKEIFENKKLWKQKALNGIKKIEQEHNPEKYAESLKNIYVRDI